MAGKSFGGEGKENYKGLKTDKKLSQIGGEGKMFKMGGDKSLLDPRKKGYGGPGHNLGTK